MDLEHVVYYALLQPDLILLIRIRILSVRSKSHKIANPILVLCDAHFAVMDCKHEENILSS